MFGFHDYTIDSLSGRPHAHYSWAKETIVTWAACASAAISLFGAFAFYLRGQGWEGPTQMALASLMLASIAYWRRNMLARKRAALRDAIKEYEAMLTRSFG